VIRTQISLTEQQAAALRRLAAARAMSQAAVIRDAIDSITDTAERAGRVERARSAIGAFASGHSGTSANHDVVLDEGYR
jgi:hypothetical protein